MWPSDEAKLPPPWDRFLAELDGLLREQVHVHCIGGFVVSLFYGLPRPTADVDYFAVVPYGCVQDLQAWAGPESMLAKKYKLYLQHFPAISLPEDYEASSADLKIKSAPPCWCVTQCSKLSKTLKPAGVFASPASIRFFRIRTRL